MNRNHTQILVFLILMLFSSVSVLAADGEEALPLWFIMLEPVGAVIGIAAVVSIFRLAKVFAQGLGTGMRLIAFGIGLQVIALIIRIFMENFGYEGVLAAETSFELCIYAGMILITLGSLKALRIIRNACEQRGAKKKVSQRVN